MLLYGFFEGSWLCPPFHLHLIVGVGPVDRVPEQRYQPCLRNHLCHPLRGGRIEQVGGGRLSGYGPPSVAHLRSWEAPPIPLGALIEGARSVEEVQLLAGRGLYEGMVREQVVEEGRPALLRPYYDEVG